jgi:lipid A 3-O-deacylase
MRWGRAAPAACAAIAATLGAAPLDGQAVRAAELRADNDYFNFWLPPAKRPDVEYTHGTALRLELGGAPAWVRRLPTLAEGSGAEAEGTRVHATVEVGQEIYNGRRGGVPTPVGERPYAGWLYVEGAAHRTGPAAHRTVSVQVGTTGPASLAGAVQRAVHEAQRYRPVPGWEDQLPAEPGIVLGVTERRLLPHLALGGLRTADVAPYAGVRVGNVRTEAEVGARVRAGLDLEHPWDPRAGAARLPLGIYVDAGVRQRLVLRDLFLDGSTFAASARVEKLPLVAAYDVGAGVRLWRVAAEYRVHTRGRSYRTEPEGHTYGTLSLRVR